MAGSLAGMLAARTGLSPVMVGRAAELARLRELAATAGDPAVVLVTGEAGIGKTRLVAELVATLDPAVPVLAGQGSQGAPGRPFQLLLEAVEPVVESWEAIPEPLAGRAEPLRLLLGPVAPELAASPERDYGQEELLRTAVALVRELVGGVAPRAADRPARALLVFEDLQWADAQSVALFGRLAVASDLPLLLVGTFRPEGVTRRHPVVDLLAELDRQRSVTTIALDRLDRTGVAELLAAVYRHPVPFRAAEALHQRTGGNPFFLEELVVTAGRADPGRLAELPLPWNLTEAVLRRLDDLTGDQRRVVEAAAILGRRIWFDLLAAVTGSGEEELIVVLRHLVAENVVVEEEPDVFAFRHALTREAIASRLLGRERRRLHEKALAALQEAGGGDHAAIAWHARGAGRYDEMVEAARQGAWSYLQQGATAEALRLAEQGLSEAERDLDLLAAASKAAWLIGLNGVAIEHGERWHQEAAAGGQPVEEANALIHLARCYWEVGDHQRQWQAVWAALRVAQPLGESRTLARAYDLVAQAHMLVGRAAEAVEWADRALALAERLDCPDVRVGALVEKGSALIDTRKGHAEGIALLEQAVAEAEAGGFGFTLHRALNNLLVHQAAVWPPARSRQVLHRMQATAERTGQASEAPGWALGESAVAVLEGDLEAALTAVREARRSAVEGVTDRWWRDFHEAPCCWRPARWTSWPSCWRGRRRSGTARTSRANSSSRAPCGWAWRPAAATWTRPGPCWPTPWPRRPGRAAGAGSTRTCCFPRSSRRCAPACPRPRSARACRARDGRRPARTRTAGARWRSAWSTWRRRCSRPRARRAPPPTPTCGPPGRGATGRPTWWPTAGRARPAACSPSATRTARCGTPARPTACWSAGAGGAATRSGRCCGGSATACPWWRDRPR
jgi:tetratricopeptide (TPR) repeat protein